MPITLNCENCGKEIRIKPSRLKRSHHFCSRECGFEGRIKRNFRDLTGQRFGKLVVMELGERVENRQYWVCHCDCGNKSAVCQYHLEDGTTKSCGCLLRETGKQMAKKNGLNQIVKIESGTRFGRWTVLRFDSVKRNSFYLCRCDCGTERSVMARNLLNGRSKSCGCYHLEVSAQTAKAKFTKHGHSKERWYIIWLKHRRYHIDREWTREMEQLLFKLQPSCIICGATERLEVDHVYPSIKGGKLEPGNVVVLCRSCNSTKHDKTLKQLPRNWREAIKRASLQFLEAWTHQGQLA